jgi:pSer/pThr/pTyr-binding forkhead associated (FHA) protein
MNSTPFATILEESRRGRPEFLDRWRTPALLIEKAAVVRIEKPPRKTFSQIVTLGRAPDADLRFEASDLAAIHATFARSGERWFVQDHNSRSGTFVNGERLGAGALRRLSDGDNLRFGATLEARFFGPKALYDFLGIVHRIGPTIEASS